MTDAVSMIAAAPIATPNDLTDRLRGDVDFDSRWVAWQSRGRSHDRALRHRLSVLSGVAVIVGGAIVSLLLIL